MHNYLEQLSCIIIMHNYLAQLSCIIIMHKCQHNFSVGYSTSLLHKDSVYKQASFTYLGLSVDSVDSGIT